MALLSAADGNWELVYKFIKTGHVDLNATNASDVRGEFTLLDYAIMQNQIYIVNDLRQHGARIAQELRQQTIQTAFNPEILTPKPFRPHEEPEIYNHFIQYFENISQIPKTDINPQIEEVSDTKNDQKKVNKIRKIS